MKQRQVRLLVEALVYGSSSEAKKAAKHLVGKSPTTKADIREYLKFKEAQAWARSTYMDVFLVPKLAKEFASEEKRLRKAGDRRGYKAIYKEIGDRLRNHPLIIVESMRDRQAAQANGR